ncbi:helix-turn-helix transcriptional regulator [Cucumibacter marinus]|uniref:helix-turn-helix transcriptional regulator n=1 Tax=Cucumibacter marinus TaxID=1121252 RepID=UPI000685B39A|nr:hypothetical protein [Cucumibacter marinus]
MLITAKVIHALPPELRRVLNRKEAASYVGVSPGHFSQLVNRGKLPSPIDDYGRVRRWDKHAIDQSLNQSSGLSSRTAAHNNQSGISNFEKWKAEHAGKA